MDFNILSDDWVKLKEIEKGDKYVDHGRELEKNYGT